MTVVTGRFRYARLLQCGRSTWRIKVKNFVFTIWDNFFSHTQHYNQSCVEKCSSAVTGDNQSGNVVKGNSYIYIYYVCILYPWNKLICLLILFHICEKIKNILKGCVDVWIIFWVWQLCLKFFKFIFTTLFESSFRSHFDFHNFWFSQFKCITNLFKGGNLLIKYFFNLHKYTSFDLCMFQYLIFFPHKICHIFFKQVATLHENKIDEIILNLCANKWFKCDLILL